MEEMVELKMVKGKTYACPPVLGPEKIVERGETVQVPVGKAKILLDDGYTDFSGNFHKYFTVVGKKPIALQDLEEDEVDEEPAEKEIEIPVREPTPRKRRTKQA